MSGVGKPGYKETAVGWIPVEWKNDTLDALVSIVYGKSPSDIAKRDSGVPIYGTGGISGYTDNSLCDGPSIILGRKGTIDKVQFSERPFWAIDTTFYTVQKTAFDWRWLYFVLSSFDLRKLNEASGVPSLSRENLAALDIATPPFPEQQKIAAILTAVDDKLDLIARQISATQTLKQGLMQALFTRGAGTPDAQGRWHPHTAFQDTELGRIPVGWRVVQLQELGSVIRGASPRPQGDPRYYGGHVPRLMGADVTRDGKWVTPKIDFLTEAGAKLSRPCPKGTLTVICSGDVGVPAFLAVEACIHDGFLALINIDDQSVSKDYLYHVIFSLKQRLDSSATHGGVFTNLTTGIFKEFRIPLPPLAEQRRIAEALDAMDERLVASKAKQTHYQSLKRGLMQKLLTGQWRVRVDAATLAPIHEKAPA